LRAYAFAALFLRRREVINGNLVLRPTTRLSGHPACSIVAARAPVQRHFDETAQDGTFDDVWLSI
jgi:hypothetical protein